MFYHLKDLKKHPIVKGYTAQFIHSSNMTFAYWEIEAGAPLPDHGHPHEQVANVLEGTFELTVEGEKRICKPGDVAVIPPNARHSGLAITACRILDVFYPVREDYVNR